MASREKPTASTSICRENCRRKQSARRGTSPGAVQGRKRNGHDVQAVVQIGPECPCLDHLRQTAVGRGDEADVHFVLGRIAHFAETPRFQHAEQLPLRFLAQVGDLIQKQRPLMGDLEKSALSGDRPGERALDMPKQFALQERRGQRGTVAGQQGEVSAAAMLMDRADDHLLAGSTFASHQDRAFGGSNAFDEGEDLPHGGAGAEHPFKALTGHHILIVGGRFRPAGNRPLVAAGFDLLQGRSQFLGRARLMQVIDRPLLDRCHR